MSVDEHDRDSNAHASRRRGRQRRIEAWYGAAFSLPAFVLLLLTILAPLAVLAWLSFTDYERGAVDVTGVGLRNFEGARRSGPASLASQHAVLCRDRVAGQRDAGTHRGDPRARSPAHAHVLRGDLLPACDIDADRDGDGVAVPSPSETRSDQWHLGVGFEAIPFLSEPALVLPTLAVIGIWQFVGFNMVLFLAGLSTTPRDVYEAAEVDGCVGAIDRFVCITWPLLAPTTMFVLVTTSITARSKCSTRSPCRRAAGPSVPRRCCST